ncbi:hypothetical protein MHY87_11755 [Microvirga sp. ACRRW]|uniref:hypothetical protein n=1 Tax=Microvirga sp. ACRRW TaxID=2918205 RepID=UPI001EF6E341|nr:hypothetical protein [Microvirga sp. ACRRW]MCG7393582.1 hypothetical protein [Microvirga sp. ACRRW]
MQVWRIEDVAARRAGNPKAAYSLNRMQTWTNGLAASKTPTFAASDSDRTVGAKMQPFQDWNFMVGTELTRSSGESRFLSSKAMWESSWSQDVKRLGGVEIGLSTAGSIDNAQTDYFQSLSGRLNVPLDLPLSAWETKLRFSPNVSMDVSNGALSSSLTSEFLGQTVLGSDAAFQSTLNVSVGYNLTPDMRPAGLAKLELRVSPKL